MLIPYPASREIFNGSNCRRKIRSGHDPFVDLKFTTLNLQTPNSFRRRDRSASSNWKIMEIVAHHETSNNRNIKDGIDRYMSLTYIRRDKLD
jgi:hypothetical protein